jgi:hypothetical protein
MPSLEHLVQWYSAVRGLMTSRASMAAPVSLGNPLGISTEAILAGQRDSSAIGQENAMTTTVRVLHGREVAHPAWPAPATEHSLTSRLEER